MSHNMMIQYYCQRVIGDEITTYPDTGESRLHGCPRADGGATPPTAHMYLSYISKTDGITPPVFVCNDNELQKQTLAQDKRKHTTKR